MPALIHFNRKWLIACDDLVIPFAIEATSRLLWLIASVIVTWCDISNCDTDNLYTKYLLYFISGDLALSASLCVVIVIISSRGAVLQVEKRIHLPKILYIKCISVLSEIAIIGFGFWFLLQDFDLCSQWKTFIEALVVNFVLYVTAVIIGVFICYNSLGSSFYWNSGKVNSNKIFKKAEHIWHLRLKYFCCCADVSEDEDDFIYVEISSFLATFSNDIDLAPTDILAGLITIGKKHAIKKRKINWSCDSDALLANTPAPSWMTSENALYYLRIAKSTYGWLAFFKLLHPWKLCKLLSPSRCCRSLFQHPNTMKQGDCCYCNSSAVEKITGLPDSDILFASFSNSVYEPAFIIALDHSKKVVIIAIRGTRSFSDLITDIDLDEMSFPTEVSSNKFKCHRGALRSALFVHKKIIDLQILKTVFYENPTYTLILTGHSLGGSIAAVLSMLLHPEYPTLQCYSYAPLAVFSAEAIRKTFDFIFSVVVGDDMVPRFSAYSFKELIKQIYSSLEETQLPKYKLLSNAFWKYLKRKVVSSKKTKSTDEAYENKQVEINDESPLEKIRDSKTRETQLYAPGQILHLKRTGRCDHSWVSGFYFQNIIISPSVIKDHQPHQIQTQLEKYNCAIKSHTLSPVEKESLKKEIV